MYGCKKAHSMHEMREHKGKSVQFVVGQSTGKFGVYRSPQTSLTTKVNLSRKK